CLRWEQTTHNYKLEKERHGGWTVEKPSEFLLPPLERVVPEYFQ
ncbi:unnamed protein product, partial [Brassica oleracea]